MLGIIIYNYNDYVDTIFVTNWLGSQLQVPDKIIFATKFARHISQLNPIKGIYSIEISQLQMKHSL